MIREGDVIPNGWFWDGEQQCYHDGTGNFYIGEQWYARPDLLAAQPFPAPPTMQDRLRMERQRLTTPWPTYREAWKEAKARKAFSRRWALYGLPFAYGLACLVTATIPSEQTEGDYATFPMFIPQVWVIVAIFLSGPFAFWKVYHSAVKRRDPHKAAAFAIASYGAVAVGAHAAANDGHLFRQTRDHVVNEARRFTG